MATGPNIQQVLADAQLYDLSWDDLAVIVKRAILNALIDQNNNCIIPISAAGKDGATISMTLDSARNLLKELLALASGGIVAQYAELGEPPKSPWLR